MTTASADQLACHDKHPYQASLPAWNHAQCLSPSNQKVLYLLEFNAHLFSAKWVQKLPAHSNQAPNRNRIDSIGKSLSSKESNAIAKWWWSTLLRVHVGSLCMLQRPVCAQKKVQMHCFYSKTVYGYGSVYSSSVSTKIQCSPLITIPHITIYWL